MAFPILAFTSSLVMWSLYKILGSLRKHLISNACFLLSMSAAMVHISHAYKNMDMAMECISLILELMAMFLSFQMTFSLVTAAVDWAILESTSGLDPSSDAIAPRYLKIWTVSSFLSREMSVLMLLVLFVINWVFSALHYRLSYSMTLTGPYNVLSQSFKQLITYLCGSACDVWGDWGDWRWPHTLCTCCAPGLTRPLCDSICGVWRHCTSRTLRHILCRHTVCPLCGPVKINQSSSKGSLVILVLLSLSSSLLLSPSSSLQ